MITYSSVGEYALGDSALALGMFDGVHLGHAALIKATVEAARENGLKAVALTYTDSPLRVLAPARAPRLLQTTEDKLASLERLGLDAAVCMPFTPEYAGMSGAEFARELALALRAKHVIVGFNYSFGKNGKCGPDDLRALGDTCGFQTHVIPPVERDGVAVSSSRIRAALASGEMERVNGMLGREYAISGTVEHGKHVGHTLGFPTANLPLPTDIALPRPGVYAATMSIDGGDALTGVLDIGRHPTLPGGHATLEINCLSEIGDIYGRRLDVRFRHFIRPERRFESAETLREQMTLDKSAAREYFVAT